jgi:predicted PurR-regulated permease PerM
VWLLIVLRRGYAFALQVAIIGFIIAYILNPLIEALGRLRVNRGLAVVLVYLVLLQLFVLGSVLLGQVVAQLSEFVRRIPRALENVGAAVTGFQAWLAGAAARLPDFLSERFGVEQSDQLAAQVQQQLTNALSAAVEALANLIEGLVTGGPSLLVTGATSIISTTLQVILILLASAYFLYDFPRFTRNAYRLVPVRWRPLYGDLVRKADGAVGGYMRGQLLITLVLGVLIWVGLSLIGVPLALAISFLAAIFNLVPYLGPIIGVVPAVLLGFTVSPLTAALAVVVFVVANQLEGNVLSPLILSRSTNLHPLTVLLAIMAGIGLLGLVGALLAVPFVALVKILIDDYLLTRPAYRQDLPVELSEFDRETA